MTFSLSFISVKSIPNVPVVPLKTAVCFLRCTGFHATTKQVNVKWKINISLHSTNSGTKVVYIQR